MPRGFLVKRHATGALLPLPRQPPPPAHQPFFLPWSGGDRVRRYSDEDRSDLSSCDDPHDAGAGSEQDVPLALTRKSVLSPTVFFLTAPDSASATIRTVNSCSSSSSSCSSPARFSPSPPKKKCRPAEQDSSPSSSSSCYPPGPFAPASGKKPTSSSSKSPRGKAIRKLAFDEDKTSPVSGTFIRDPDDSEDDGESVLPIRSGDIDPSLNVVVITDEARAELAKIENRIGDYVCQLCREAFEDAFGLAQHRCSRIVHVEYRCPDCDKVFNCPANLASHRRWHKPRPPQTKLSGQEGEEPRTTPTPPDDQPSEEALFDCTLCGKRFKRQAYLRKHLQVHASSSSSSSSEVPACRAAQFLDVSSLCRSPPGEFSPPFAGLLDCRCPVCGSACADRTALEEHFRSHTTSEVYPCKYCSCTFFSSPGLTRHVNKFHPSDGRRSLMHLLALPQTVKAS